MPIISTFFGIIIRMFFDDHAPPIFMQSFREKTPRSISAARSFMLLLVNGADIAPETLRGAEDVSQSAA